MDTISVKTTASFVFGSTGLSNADKYLIIVYSVKTDVAQRPGQEISYSVLEAQVHYGKKVRTLANGNLGIRTTTSTADYKLDVIGLARCESLTQYSSKDYRQGYLDFRFF